MLRCGKKGVKGTRFTLCRLNLQDDVIGASKGLSRQTRVRLEFANSTEQITTILQGP